MGEIVTYVNKETGVVEKQDLETGEVYTPEQFYNYSNRSNLERKKYNLEDAAKICAFVRDGYPLAAIPKLVGIEPDTMYFWRRSHPDFKEALKEARLIAAEAFANKAVQAAEDAANVGKDGIPACKLQVDTYKWMAEKMDPEVYGNRTKVVGDVDQPVAIMINTGIVRTEQPSAKPAETITNDESDPS